MQNLVRHKSGRYYARTFGNNKEIWKSLRTDHFSVAKARLAEFLREHREKQAATANHSSAKMTFAEALAIHLQNDAERRCFRRPGLAGAPGCWMSAKRPISMAFERHRPARSEQIGLGNPPIKIPWAHQDSNLGQRDYESPAHR